MRRAHRLPRRSNLGHTAGVRIRGGLGALLGIAMLVAEAHAEERTPPQTEVTPPVVTTPTVVDRLLGKPALADLAAALLSRFVSDQRAEFDRLAVRYSKLVQFTKSLEARDEAEFNARAERFERLHLFTRRLEAERVAEETRNFDAHVELVLREIAFTKQLEHLHATGPEAPDRGSDGIRDRLYQRK